MVEKQTLYLVGNKEKNSSFYYEVGKEYEGNFTTGGYHVYETILDALKNCFIYHSDIFECICYNVKRYNLTTSTCKRMKILHKLTMEDVLTDIKRHYEIISNKNTDKLFISHKDSYEYTKCYDEVKATFLLRSPCGRFDNCSHFNDAFLIEDEIKCNLTSHHNTAVSLGDFNKLNSNGDFNTIISYDDENNINVNSSHNNIISLGTDTIIMCNGENNSVVCNSCHNTVFIHGRHNRVQAECGTKIVFSDYCKTDSKDYTTVSIITIDRKEFHPNAWYTMENGIVTEC